MAFHSAHYYWHFVSLMIMPLVNTQYLPCRIDYKKNTRGSWSQAANGRILEELSWNSKWVLGMSREKKSQLLRALGASLRLAERSGNTLQTRPVQLAAEWQTCFMSSRLDGVREVGTLKCLLAGIKGRRRHPRDARAPAGETLTQTRGQVCRSPFVQWRDHIPGPLWFLSITYQPGQSVAEIKQLLETDALWTQREENSPGSAISLNLKRDINPLKAEITLLMTAVTETDSHINTTYVWSSVLYLMRQKENMSDFSLPP